MRLTPTELIFVSKFRSLLLGDLLASRVLVSAFWRYRVSFQRKKCCQQIIGLNDKSFSIAVCTSGKEQALRRAAGRALKPRNRVTSDERRRRKKAGHY